MIRTSLMALIVGLLATGCVVTTGGKPAGTNQVNHHQHRRPNHSGNNTAAPAPAPAPAPATGGEAVAAPPVATPAPATGGATPAALPNFTRVPGMQPVATPPAEEEEEDNMGTKANKRTRTPAPVPTR